MNPPPITQVCPQTLKARLDAGEALVIVDVRETGEYSLAHIPGSINSPCCLRRGRGSVPR